VSRANRGISCAFLLLKWPIFQQPVHVRPVRKSKHFGTDVAVLGTFYKLDAVHVSHPTNSIKALKDDSVPEESMLP